MNFYAFNVVILAALNGLLFYRKCCHDRISHNTGLPREIGRKEDWGGSEDCVEVMKLEKLKWMFLPVYACVVGADWLQGPYIYTIYKDTKSLSESTVAYLFTTGFLSAALSALCTGTFSTTTHRHQRLACQVFCIIYALSCLSLLSSSLAVLFTGRVLGGIASTLMFSVFESWMIMEYHRLGLGEEGEEKRLNEIFGLMSTLNGVVAIVAGVVAQWVTDVSGSQMAPFWAAVGCLTLAFLLILRWNNVANQVPSTIDQKDTHSDTKTNESNAYNRGTIMPHKNPFRVIMSDRRLWVLCLTTSFFEGSMFLWIFFKFPLLRAAHALSHSLLHFNTALPYGTIFAALMCAMMLGSLLFTWYSTYTNSSSTLLTLVLTLSSLSFCAPVLVRFEAVTFYSFCLFEICVGVYYPVMAGLRERYVDDDRVRTRVYAILRVPLNVFVVVGLGVTKDGAKHRRGVFIFCSSTLLVAAAVVEGVLE
ncbi:hypothetical protein F5884DRAFT_677486 [Xylogone sp. PMI_703]|nr:hypothetical protein F5884DRAFT_677486 [Xylogone sp. PMI_703]